MVPDTVFRGEGPSTNRSGELVTEIDGLQKVFKKHREREYHRNIMGIMVAS